MSHINKEGKPVKMPKWSPKMDLEYENCKKIVDNEMAYYEKNWPFNRPKNGWQEFLFFFANFKIFRRLMGGTWIQGDLFGYWLQVNKHFPQEWLKNHPHEIYKPRGR